MILKQDILSRAHQFKLLPTTIEKDYVLSWVLYGIANNADLSKWIFKGGTCLKKCYFEHYRFSEDLDFTAPFGTIYDQAAIQNGLEQIAKLIYQMSGIDLQTRPISVEPNINKNKQITYVAKLTYQGPLNLPSRNQQRIKFDITQHEVIVDTPSLQQVFHAYSDTPKNPTKIRCYSINEILAEKTRALYERQGRARDVYDLVQITQHFSDHIDPHKLKQIIQKKFEFKGLPMPDKKLIFSQLDWSVFEKNWIQELEHQLQSLPTATSIYKMLEFALSECLG